MTRGAQEVMNVLVVEDQALTSGAAGAKPIHPALRAQRPCFARRSPEKAPGQLGNVVARSLRPGGCALSDFGKAGLKGFGFPLPVRSKLLFKSALAVCG